jgi:hypothetical protein
MSANLLGKCLICSHLCDFMACERCQTNMRHQLADIPRFALMASERLEPRQGGSRGTERGFGLSMAALEASCGFDAIAVLENWVRDWRETYNLVPYGVATENIPNSQLLTHICQFLTTWLDRACTDHIAIDLFAGELRQQWAAMREGAGETPANSWVIPCPADIQRNVDGEVSVGLCGTPIKIADPNFDAEVSCRICKTHWKVSRLLYVGASANAGGIYVDAEAASQYLGVSERTLRQWANAGKIHRERGRYDITTLP